MTLHPIPLNFLIYEENFLFFFISVVGFGRATRTCAPVLLGSLTDIRYTFWSFICSKSGNAFAYRLIVHLLFQRIFFYLCTEVHLICQRKTVINDVSSTRIAISNLTHMVAEHWKKRQRTPGLHYFSRLVISLPNSWCPWGARPLNTIHAGRGI